MPKKRRSRSAKRPSASLRARELTNAQPASSIPKIAPQLANASDAVPPGDQWLHEIKFDGYRLLCYLDKGKVQLLTRRGHDWTDKFREVAEALKTLAVPNAVLDGELIALDASGRASFGAMQNATRSSRARHLQLHLFDLPFCDGIDLRRTPLLERKALLQQLLAQRSKDDVIHFSDHVTGHGNELLASACQRGLEGTISKRINAEYVSARTSSWLKNKCKKRQELVIGGYSDPEGARSGFGALVMGYYQDSRLIYAGRVGTGFNEKTLKSLYGRLTSLLQTVTPFAVPPRGADAKGVHWVKPKLVAEVEFTEWTSDGRLRHPSYLGLREDKAATEVVREREVHPAPAGTSTVKHSKLTAGAGGLQVGPITISNPDRVVFPKAKVTKGMLAEYYEAIAARILPHIVNRPLTIVRCPKGLPSKCFYQRHVNETLPPTLRGVSVREDDKVVQYIVIDDLAGLLSLIQLSTLEIHPWGSTADNIEKPDRLIFDLDPGPGVSWKRVIEAALTVRAILAAAKLKSFVQTSGGKGLHVIIPIVPRANWDEAKAFCKAVAQLIASREPKKYTAILSKSRRVGKIFIDYLRNGRGATSVATYSTRARETASVATPVRWEELDTIRRADMFTVKNLSERLKSLQSDPWVGYFRVKQELPRLLTR